MPDFLHHETDSKIAPAGAERLASPASDVHGANHANEQGKDTRHAARGPEGEAILPKKKPPMRLFTDYYGAMFLGVIALFILSGFLFLEPLITDYKMMSTDVSDAGVTLKEDRDYLNSLRASVAAAEAIPPNIIANIDEALPRTVGIPKLLETMAAISETTGVRLSSVSFTETKAAPDSSPAGAQGLSVSPIDISLTLSANDYATMKTFLNRLERNLRIMDVQSINVSGGGTTFEYSIQLRTYTLSQPAPKPPPQPAPASTTTVAPPATK
jgi:hypothetical protein